MLRHLDGSVGARSFIALLTIIVICQFLLGLELLADAALFGLIALAVAWLIWHDHRAQLRRVILLALISCGLATIALSPLLFQVLASSGMGRHRVWSDHGADLLESVVPGHVFLLGHLLGFDNFSATFDHFSRDLGGYVGLPIVIVAALFFAALRKLRIAHFLGAMLAISYLAALGPSLHLAGRSLVPMPWRLFESLPFINSAQAVRFTVFVDLILAIIVAMWIAEAKLRGGAKIAIAMVIIFSIMPNVLDQSLWATDSHLPEFITSGTFRDYLRPDENVLVLPFGPQGNAMVWQTLSGMYFAMPEGWTGPTPPSFAAWPIMDVFAYGIDIPGKQTQFNAFMGAHGATAVVIDRNSPDAAKWMDLIDPASAQVQKLVEVIIARPSAEALARFRAATATAMQCRRDEVRLPAVIAAAAGYIKGGYPLDQLTPRAAEDRGLLPPAWVEANDGATFARSGIALGSADGDRVMVGVKTAAGCAKAFVEKYGPEVAEVRFPYPRIWGAKKLPDSHDGRFVLILSRYGLARAAASLHSTAHQARTH